MADRPQKITFADMRDTAPSTTAFYRGLSRGAHVTLVSWIALMPVPVSLRTDVEATTSTVVVRALTALLPRNTDIADLADRTIRLGRSRAGHEGKAAHGGDPKKCELIFHRLSPPT
jgi:hypothetical protein